ncbi:MAG: MBL fold metallo-hydrolase [Pseudomonadota bacterium]
MTTLTSLVGRFVARFVARIATPLLPAAAALALPLTLAAPGVFAPSAPAHAQMVSNCQAIARALPGSLFVPVSTQRANPKFEVEITYVGHATFMITAADGTSIATDYSGFHGEGPLPTVVTMNHAHITHWTPNPNPEIQHVLRGWNPEGGKAEHFLTVGEVLIRNVPTDIRRWSGGIEENGNSIFIFEIAGLCIGHLGHLHQPLSDGQIAEIGRLDVVFVPIDGGYTMPHEEMMSVVERLRTSVAIPMHWFSRQNLTRFLMRSREAGLEIDIRQDPTIRVSLNTLPRAPTMVVLPRQHPF